MLRLSSISSISSVFAQSGELLGLLGVSQEESRHYVDSSLSLLTKLVIAVLASAIVWFAARAVQRLVRGMFARSDRGQQAVPLITRAIQMLFAFIGLSLILSIFDLSSASAALTGIVITVGLTLGLAAQDLVANLLTWVVMPYSWPFKSGDYVQIGEQAGLVHEISAQNVVLTTRIGTIVRVPNRQVFRETVINHSALGKHRVCVRVPLAAHANLGEARMVAEQAIAEHSLRDPARDVEVHFEGWGPDGIRVEVSFWVDYRSDAEIRAARSEAVARIKAAWETARIMP